MLSKPDGFMLYDKIGVDFFSTFELFYPNMKLGLRLIRARPNFYMISGNLNVSLGIVDCSVYTRRIALKSDYQKKRMKGHARIFSCGDQLYGDSSQAFYQSR